MPHTGLHPSDHRRARDAQRAGSKRSALHRIHVNADRRHTGNPIPAMTNRARRRERPWKDGRQERAKKRTPFEVRDTAANQRPQFGLKSRAKTVIPNCRASPFPVIFCGRFPDAEKGPRNAGPQGKLFGQSVQPEHHMRPTPRATEAGIFGVPTGHQTPPTGHRIAKCFKRTLKIPRRRTRTQANRRMHNGGGPGPDPDPGSGPSPGPGPGSGSGPHPGPGQTRARARAPTRPGPGPESGPGPKPGLGPDRGPHPGPCRRNDAHTSNIAAAPSSHVQFQCHSSEFH